MGKESVRSDMTRQERRQRQGDEAEDGCDHCLFFIYTNPAERPSPLCSRLGCFLPLHFVTVSAWTLRLGQILQSSTARNGGDQCAFSDPCLRSLCIAIADSSALRSCSTWSAWPASHDTLGGPAKQQQPQQQQQTHGKGSLASLCTLVPAEQPSAPWRRRRR